MFTILRTFVWRQVPRFLLAACLFAPFHAAPAATAAAPAALAPAQLMARAALAFVPNAGQSDPRVLFQVSSPAGSLFFTAGQVVIALPQGKAPGELPESLAARIGDAPLPAAPHAAQSIQLSFVGADPTAQLSGQDQLPGVANYILGSDPAGWHTGLPTYAGITYHGLYPGVDLQYTSAAGAGGATGALKGTFVVAPGADPAQIHWQYAGAGLQVDAAGDLRVSLPAGGPAQAQSALTLTEQAPVSWQTVAGRQVAVETRYTVGPAGLR